MVKWLHRYMAKAVGNGPERFHKYCSRALRPSGSGLFGFWLRFRPVTGRCGHAPSLKPCQKPKILAPHGYNICGKAPGRRAETELHPSRNRAGTEPWLTFARLCSGLLAFARLLPGNFFFAGTERRPSELRQLRLKSKSTTWLIGTQAVKTMQHAEFHVAAARASLIAAVRGVGQQPPKLPRGTETPAAGRREDVKLF
jgi:hypothetical protein